MPYQLRIENISAYQQECRFCEESMCRADCPLPFCSKTTVLDLMQKIPVEDNVSYYNGGKGRRDLTLHLRWQRDFKDAFQTHLSSVEKARRIDIDETLGENDDMKDHQQEITIDDCFDEFSKPEMLDEDNKWYCSKCKDHVQATKTLEIFRAPPIFVINLKRFKMGKTRYGTTIPMWGAGGNQKLSDHVAFPLKGLDLSDYVKGQKVPEEMIYDCYAVSNHYGNMGFGHYTAFAKNPRTGLWYEFDDSKVTAISEQHAKQQIVTEAAYNLFYRRRSWHEDNLKGGCDFDALAQRPDMAVIPK